MTREGGSNRPALIAGDKVRFLEPASEVRKWWEVRYDGSRYTILTRQADFRPKGEKFYTIIDWKRGLGEYAWRGPTDRIFNFYNLDHDAPDLEKLYDDLVSGEVRTSRRNRVEVIISEVRKAK